jgi:hypothetical protein
MATVTTTIIEALTEVSFRFEGTEERNGDAELSMGVADDKLSAADDREPRVAREGRVRAVKATFFASRLVAAGVDLRTVQELGGWRTLSMVQRYAHLSPGHLAAAVEKTVAVPTEAATKAASPVELRQNFDAVATVSRG